MIQGIADRPASFLASTGFSTKSVLSELAKVEPKLAELVDMKFFCGFSFAEIAALENLSERTVQRRWEKARI
jgi:DNA-directed RNA polymerase specialized sigma24 family protein